MTDHQRYNKIRKKLNDREFIVKMLFDQHGEEVRISSREQVYLKSEVDEVLGLFKTAFEEFSNELVLLRKRNDDLELKNYRLQKTLKRKKRSIFYEKSGNNLS